MSIALDTRYVTDIYALGQWFEVTPGTLTIDAYEMRDYVPCVGDPEEYGAQFTDYMLGTMYKDDNPSAPLCGSYGSASNGGFSRVTGGCGLAFIELSTGKRVAFSLMEAKAFKEGTRS